MLYQEDKKILNNPKEAERRLFACKKRLLEKGLSEEKITLLEGNIKSIINRVLDKIEND